jgi:hypothetical protein
MPIFMLISLLSLSAYLVRRQAPSTRISSGHVRCRKVVKLYAQKGIPTSTVHQILLCNIHRTKKSDRHEIQGMPDTRRRLFIIGILTNKIMQLIMFSLGIHFIILPQARTQTLESLSIDHFAPAKTTQITSFAFPCCS